MKKLLMGLSLIALLAGCASSDNGMGGTSDNYYGATTDNYDNSYNYNHTSGAQFHNNATYGTGSSTGKNNTGQTMAH